MSTNIKLAGLQAPRYTSYPTAPNFTEEVGAADYAGWLANVPAAEPVSLYFHVPFCQSLCHYCGCHTKATLRQAPVDQYAADLAAELATVRNHLGMQRPVGHIHWGGGTPSMIGIEALQRFSDTIARDFTLTGDTEHAIELDPRHVTSALAKALPGCGVNRVSLGVQDFNPRVQNAIGRIQPYDLVVAVVERLRRNNIDKINFDLIYGLPAQSTSDLVATIERTIALQPSRIALFGYAHVPWFKKNQRMIDESLLPGSAERIEQVEVASETLIASGYEMIGLDHFALPDDPLAIAARDGTLRRNFQGYTTDTAETLIGMGASSIGQFAEGYVQNDPAVNLWSNAAANGQLAIKRGYRLTNEDRARRRIIEKLMCSLTVDPVQTAGEYGIDPAVLASSMEALKPLEEDGYVSVENGIVTVPEHARHFMRLAAVAFDAYHADAPKRHAQAV